jgi:hypothetical protein
MSPAAVALPVPAAVPEFLEPRIEDIRRTFSAPSPGLCLGR